LGAEAATILLLLTTTSPVVGTAWSLLLLLLGLMVLPTNMDGPVVELPPLLLLLLDELGPPMR
jgi:hypothetical protein